MDKVREDIIINDKRDEYGSELELISDKLEWFKDQKIGVIFHFGIYTEGRMCESWPLVEQADWARTNLPIEWVNMSNDDFRKRYWGLNKSFNPAKFNPDLWAETCLNAGIKYMLFTTKHHDGFSMYDTKYSSYKVTNSSCSFHDNKNADIFKAVCDSFRRKDISVGAYYSKADWHSPFYWVPNFPLTNSNANYDPAEYPEIWGNYNEFVMNQIDEICNNYGPMDILWLDAGGVNKLNNEYLDMDRLSEVSRRNNPDLLVVDRTIGGKYENYETPEQHIPDITKLPKKAWESGITLSQNWGYTEADVYKSNFDILKMLLTTISLGGNVLLGVGPDPDGELPIQAVERLEFLGSWLDTYGVGIYETRPLEIIQSSEKVFFTKKNKLIYLFYSSESVGETINLNEIAEFKGKEIETVKQVQNESLVTFENGNILLPETTDLFSCLEITVC